MNMQVKVTPTTVTDKPTDIGITKGAATYTE